MPVSGRRIRDDIWFVSEFGERSDDIRNIEADPHTGSAQLLPDDNALRRLTQLGKLPALAIQPSAPTFWPSA